MRYSDLRELRTACQMAGLSRELAELLGEMDALHAALAELLAVAPSTAPASGIIVGIEDRHRKAIAAARAALAYGTP